MSLMYIKTVFRHLLAEVRSNHASARLVSAWKRSLHAPRPRALPIPVLSLCERCPKLPTFPGGKPARADPAAVIVSHLAARTGCCRWPRWLYVIPGCVDILVAGWCGTADVRCRSHAVAGYEQIAGAHPGAGRRRTGGPGHGYRAFPAAARSFVHASWHSRHACRHVGCAGNRHGRR